MTQQIKKESNSTKLRKLQDIVDEYNRIKSEIEERLNVLDDLEKDYDILAKEIKENK